MFFLIKFFCYFLLSFIILSVPINRKTVFSHLSIITTPYTKKLFTHVETKAINGMIEGKKISQKFFGNTVPETKDAVKRKLSAIKRKNNSKESHSDNYTIEEKQLLLEVLKKAQ